MYAVGCSDMLTSHRDKIMALPVVWLTRDDNEALEAQLSEYVR